MDRNGTTEFSEVEHELCSCRRPTTGRIFERRGRPLPKVWARDEIAFSLGELSVRGCFERLRLRTATAFFKFRYMVDRSRLKECRSSSLEFAGVLELGGVLTGQAPWQPNAVKPLRLAIHQRADVANHDRSGCEHFGFFL